MKLMRNPDEAACHALLRGGSRSFHAASFLLPPAPRRAATALYAFCREADDAVDQAAGGDLAAVLADLRWRLAAIYRGAPANHAADRAFAAVVAQYRIPSALPESLLQGFAWDAAGRRYTDLADLLAYAVRVAGTVGAMMAMVMGARHPATLARAIELGMAMQLSNIMRDVGEDAAAGRLYLPLAWLDEAGIDAADFLRAPVCSPALRAVLCRLAREAGSLYDRATPGIAHLPAACRPGIHAARLLYRAIGETACGADHDAVRHRAIVPAAQKRALLLHALPASLAPAAACAEPPHQAAAQLLARVLAAEPKPPLPAAAAKPSRLAWTIDLFAALAMRDRAANYSAP